MDKKIIDFKQAAAGQYYGIIKLTKSGKNTARVHFEDCEEDYIYIDATDPDTGAQLFKKAAELIKKDRKKYLIAAGGSNIAYIV